MDAHNCRMIEPEPRVTALMDQREMVSLDRTNLPRLHTTLDKRFLSGPARTVRFESDATPLPVRRIARHALDRNTFRQSTGGLTILRGASSPIYPLRHRSYSTFPILHGALLVDSRAATSTSRRQLRLLHRTR